MDTPSLGVPFAKRLPCQLLRQLALLVCIGCFVLPVCIARFAIEESALRPHVRLRTRVILVSVALSLAGVAGCSSSSAPSVAPPVAAPTVAASQGATQIIATYTKFMTEYVAAYNSGNPNNPDFISLGGGNAAGLKAVIQDAIDHGVIARGKPTWSRPVVQFVDENETIASVTFCFNPATWITVKSQTADSQSPEPIAPALDETSHPPRPAYPEDRVGPYTVLMLLNRNSAAKWSVAQANAQPDRPC
jgi:hypothetical protein